MSSSAGRGFAKKYGQVFLRNREIAIYEVNLLNREYSSVLEIGPGEGALTEVLLENGFTVYAVEPDHSFALACRVCFPEQLIIFLPLSEMQTLSLEYPRICDPAQLHRP